MNRKRLVRSSLGLAVEAARRPLRSIRSYACAQPFLRGARFAAGWKPGEMARGAPGGGDDGNPLRAFCEGNVVGPGVFKWDHYFEVYHRHLSRFVGKPVHLVEVGVYSGGSLRMWRSYLGPDALVTGVDIEPACTAYEDDSTRIRIGDQADRGFWKSFWEESPPVDVVIDDGGHEGEQMIVTLEECLPRLRPGGVFICEDVHNFDNEFASYAAGLEDAMNEQRPGLKGDGIRFPTSSFQSEIGSIHRYPFAVVIEKRDRPLERLELLRRGTEWQPFFEKGRPASP